MRYLSIPILFFLSLFAACADSPMPVGARCEPSADSCGDGSSCGTVAQDSTGDVDICTARCEVPGPEEDLPADVPPQCPIGGVCMAVPQGFNECLALCDEDGDCADGDPGFPFNDHPDVCVCIPWRRS